jgi:hypothetical protein
MDDVHNLIITNAIAAWNSGMFMREDVQASVAATRRKLPATYRDLMSIDLQAIPRKPTKGQADV